MVFLLGAANRDPAVFASPDTLDIQRSGTPALAFGYGIHFCLGAALARVEGRIALQVLLPRLPELVLDSASLDWHASLTRRSLTSLPVRFRSAG